MPNLLDTPFPNHPPYRDGLRLWTSKLIKVPEHWSQERKEKEARRLGTERIAKGVAARYGEERELCLGELIPLGKCYSDALFVYLAYVPCDYEENPDHHIITDLSDIPDGLTVN
jgi:hypothetical protein